MAQRGVITLWYGLTGVLSGLWGASLPATDARLDLGTGRLGGVLLALAAGALVAMPVAGRLADRWTARRVLRLVGPAAALALAGPAMVPSFGPLVISAAVLGMVFGTLNVALSAQAVAVEAGLGRPVMATLHGTWTLGAVAGGGVISAGLGIGVDVRVLLAAGALALTVVGCAIGAPPVAAPPRAAALPATAVRAGLVVTLGVIGAAAFVAEGAATDWAGVHATRVLGAEPATASLTYTAFFVAMTIVRFLGDAARARLGATVTIRLAGGVATVGYGLVLVAGALPEGRVGCAIAGWALAGAGIAVV
jgi:MFS family permease